MDAIQKSPHTAGENSVLNEALSLMLASGFKSLPVLDKAKRLKGVLTLDAIQAALHEAIENRESGP